MNENKREKKTNYGCLSVFLVPGYYCTQLCDVRARQQQKKNSPLHISAICWNRGEQSMKYGIKWNIHMQKKTKIIKKNTDMLDEISYLIPS